ncbi:MAG: DUF4870 domain-containing protein [Planctomycetota bacterium]
MGVAVKQIPYENEPGSFVKVYGLEVNRTQPKDRLREENLSDSERHISLWTHVSLPLVAFILTPFAAFVAPMVVWLVQKDSSPFSADHGKEALNFTISFFLLHLITLVTFIGVILWPVIWIVGFVSVVRAAVAAGHGEYFRYPMTFRFIS